MAKVLQQIKLEFLLKLLYPVHRFSYHKVYITSFFLDFITVYLSICCEGGLN